MLRTTLVVALVSVITFAAGCATRPKYEAKARDVQELFKKADTDGDGRVSRAEFANFMIEEAFNNFDQNEDGFVTLDEFKAAGGTEADFRRINRSGTGKITLAEAKTSRTILERMTTPFDEADLNGDGYVTWEEFQTYRQKARPYTYGL